MIKSIRILLSIAAHMDYEIWQMDVKTAFLNESLEETIYVVHVRKEDCKPCFVIFVHGSVI